MNKHDPLVSVIICTHNRKDLVTRAIDSVFAQESVRTEVVVVDDCSQDVTFETLDQRYGERIVLVRLDENRRVAFATNRGFDNSSGDFIALLGDDDYWTDTRKLRKQLAVFERSDPDLGMVGTWWSDRNDAGELIPRRPEEPADWAERLLEGGGIIGGSTVLIPRSVWETVGGLDERMPRGTDSDLFRRIILTGHSGKIVQYDTTVIDVGHGLGRMTSNRGLREARRTAFAHSYLLWKYRSHYIRHPRALLVRIRYLVITPLRAILGKSK
jgi:glycosyltransferase involved in cell wall biosynthesis